MAAGIAAGVQTVAPLHAAETAGSDVLATALDLAGADRTALAPDPLRLLSSSTSKRQNPFYRALMSDPLRAAYRVGMLESAFRARIDSPHRLMMVTGSLAGVDVARGYVGNPTQEQDDALLASPDPLAAGLAMMARGLEGTEGWRPALPDEATLPRPLRLEIARVLAAIGQANRFRQRAFAAWPKDMTPQRLLRQAIEGKLEPFEEPDFRRLFPLVEREALMAGMLDLVAAVERLDRFLAATPGIPAVSWRLQTPLGLVVIDTTAANNRHVLEDPLLVVDVGGDDLYRFTTKTHGDRISVLLDRGGNDHYIAEDTAADPSSAVMGFGILWDTEGDDRYEAGTFAQGAALFGAALLVDGGGTDSFAARGYAQAFALGGVALVVSMGGDDSYQALTHAQGSGGPEGTAVLLDVAGNDRYTLGNEPLVLPSPQLPARNVSMGQGAGWGIRADFSDGRSTTGGIGALFDFAGDDRYTAQVFAQGAGFHEGAGMLVDGGGRDVFDAAWYAMAASAHRAAGVLIKRGDGDDVYTASHSTSIGAAHDSSIAFFIDEGGNDRYDIGHLGIGAAHDNSAALFVDASGDDRYTVRSGECIAFGAAHISQWGTIGEDAPNLGIFLDLSGNDTYASSCPRPANNSAWAWPRRFPDLKLRSEAGAGIDGEYASPFHTQARTLMPDRGRAAPRRRKYRMAVGIDPHKRARIRAFDNPDAGCPRPRVKCRA